MSEQEKALISNTNEKPKEIKKSMIKIFMSEVIGTGLFLIFPCYVAVHNGDNPVLVNLAFACSIVALGYSFGNLSGFQINPAMSLGFFLRKKMLFSELIWYVTAQFTGATIGSFILGTIQGDYTHVCSTTIQKALANENGELTGRSYFNGFLVEVAITYLFSFIINAAGDGKYNNPQNATFVVASAVIAISTPAGNFTGCSMNPARSFGPALIESMHGNHTAFSQLWIYLLGPTIGASLGAVTYSMVA